MKKDKNSIIFVEDGSVDIDEVKKYFKRVIVYRAGGQLPTIYKSNNNEQKIKRAVQKLKAMQQSHQCSKRCSECKFWANKGASDKTYCFNTAITDLIDILEEKND